MLPMSDCGRPRVYGMVSLHLRWEGEDTGPDTPDARRGSPRRAGAPLRGDRRRRDADALPDGAAGSGRAGRSRDRADRAAQPGHRAAGAAPLPGGGPGRRPAAAVARAATPSPGGLAGGVGAGGRAGPARSRGAERGLDHRPAGRLPGRGDRPPGGDRHGPRLAAPAGLRLQAARLEPQAQGHRAAGVGKKRVRVEALLAAAASPAPPPFADLVPDPTLADLLPTDLPRLLELLPRADLYLQDEVEVALHPTLTRVWSRKGRRGQRLVEAPGTNRKRYGFGLADWRDGWLDWELADGRRAAPFCAQLRRAVARSAARGRIALVLLDNLSIHTPAGSRLL